MRDPTLSLISALRREPSGFVVVWCSDFATRDWLVSEVESIVGSDAPRARVSSAAEALDLRDTLVLLLPDDEVAAVRDLDARRDSFLDPPRNQPVVLFLLRDGAGQRALAAAPGFASVVRGSDPDPERLAEIDSEAERREFKRRTRQAPSEWLAKWRAGRIRQNARNLALYYRALLLEGR